MTRRQELGAIPALSTLVALFTRRLRSMAARSWLPVGSSSTVFPTLPTDQSCMIRLLGRGAILLPLTFHAVSIQQLFYSTEKCLPRAVADSTLQIHPSCTTLALIQTPIRSMTHRLSCVSSIEIFSIVNRTQPGWLSGLMRSLPAAV